ncbi:6199_t:CDS:2 [Dentiscutata erythropus]|uniref:6199_t:CDS:1 n=1 Tax=Dentiscutata erythropus TaxID=1348616 RepID=A0A9N9HZP7_9GLOM|nr:6199_t:CDS:2 [Dentiscutata erythropus]
MNFKGNSRRDDEQVAHLVKGLSLDEDQWMKFDNQSMGMEHTRCDSNVDNWEPNRYEVDHVIAHKVVNGRDFYLVVWKGYSKDTWEPVENLDDCREKLYDFHKLSNEIKLNDQLQSDYEFDPEERKLFLDALQDSSSVNYELYDKVILGRTKDFNYLSEPTIESVPISEIGERGKLESELNQKDEDSDLYDLL